MIMAVGILKVCQSTAQSVGHPSSLLTSSSMLFQSWTNPRLSLRWILHRRMQL